MIDTSCRRLAEAVCVVTGGGSGAGRAIATRLAAEGARVVVLDSDVASGREAEQAISKPTAPGEAKFVRASVSEEAAVRGVMHAVADEWGGIDGVVTTPAASTDTSLLDVSEEQGDWGVDATRSGVFFCTKHAAPILADGGGSILNVVSTTAQKRPTAAAAEVTTTPACEGAEHGLFAFTRGSAIELSESGIRVNSLSLTRRGEAMNQEEDADGSGPMWWQAPEQEAAAPAAAYLLSDDAALVTGMNLPVGGGASL